jgi:hypothetical protein
MSEVVLLLPHTDRLQQNGDYVRGCSTSTTYWPPSTRWRLCQMLFYFYHVLTGINKMEIMSDVVLLLPRTDRLQQDGDYVRGCSPSTTYWPPSTRWRLCQRLFYFYHRTDRLQQDGDYVTCCSTSTIVLTDFNKLEIMSDDVLLLPSYWPPSTS